MWHDLWTKHQKGLLFAVGMICFLAAGLVVVSFPYSAGSSGSARRQAREHDGANRYSPPAESRIVNEVTSNAANEFSGGRPIVGAATSDVREPEREWVLYITGAVRRPGVYSLPAGSRLLQLVDAAGGLDISADPVAVNLAGFLQDGLHVHVPAKGEEPPAHVGFPQATRGTSASPGGGPPGMAIMPININRASAEELTALRGIGPAIAGNIVEYRLRVGRFHNVDDLLHVTGIGHVRLEQLRNYVTVGP